MSLNILITGGFGYIGGRLAKFLAEQGHNVYLGTRHECSSPDWLPQAHVVRMRWRMNEEWDDVCKTMDVIIHTAGMNAQDCAKDPVRALEFNGVCTARFLYAAVRQRVRRFIYLSTAHVYGSPLMNTITEKTHPTNLHPYATSHLAGENAVLSATQLGEIEGVVIRLSNVFGSPMDKKSNCWTLLFNDLCRQAVITRAMVLQSTGMQRRNFIPLVDVCRAIEHLLHLPQKNINPSLLNVGGDWTPTVSEVANLIQQQCKLILGFQPMLSRVKVEHHEQEHLFEYRSDILSQTGFQYRADRMTELQNLLMFCRQSFV